MELRQYLLVLWKWAWMIVLATGFAAVLSYLATKEQPRIYQASAKLLVGQSLQSTTPNSQDLQTSQQLAQTYIQIAKTTPVLTSALEGLGLKMSPQVLSDRFSATLIPGTQLIQLRVDDTDPMRAQALANELSRQLTLLGPTNGQDAQQREFLQKQVDDLQAKIQEGQKSIADLQSSIQVTLSAREIAAKQQQIASLEAQVERWQQTYSTLLGYLAPRSPNFLSVIEPAGLPDKPYSPNLPLNVALAASIGLILSLGAALLMEYLDDTLRHPDDITRLLGLSVLSTLGRLGGNPEDKLITALAPRSSAAEAYRVLRTNVQFGGVDKPLRSILVTSPNLQEGKSITAANLAIVMAQSELRTILVDCDLRKPSLHRLFHVDNDDGLTQSLLKQPTQELALHTTLVDNLCLLTTGALPPNPAELLNSERMHALKARLEAEFDMVIFDIAPCLPVTDAAVLGRLVDGVVLVVDVTRTGRREALRAKEVLAKVGARILGVALNRVPPRNTDYYYHHDYATAGSKPAKTSASSVRSRRGSLEHVWRTFIRH